MGICDLACLMVCRTGAGGGDLMFKRCLFVGWALVGALLIKCRFWTFCHCRRGGCGGCRWGRFSV
jgi:hypothetical protein